MRLLVGFLVLIIVVYAVSPLVGQDVDVKVEVGNNGGTANAAGDASDASGSTRTSPSLSSESSLSDASLSEDPAAPSDAPGNDGEITGDKAPSGSDKQPRRGSDSSNGTKASGRTNLNDTRISMSFDKADVNSVIKFLSMSSGIPIVVDPELKGNVTIISLKQITLADAFEVVNAALRVRNYTLVGDPFADKVLRVQSLKKSVADNVPVRAGTDPDAAARGDSMVTQVMPLQYASATRLKDELKPLVSDEWANITAISSTNTLVVTDSANNVHRLAQIVQALDKDTSDVIEVRVHRCKYSSADALVEVLNKVFPASRPTSGQPPRGGGAPPPEGSGGQPPQVKSDEGLISLKGEIRIASDARTNSLIISASKDKIKLVMDVVEELDQDVEPEVTVQIFQLKYADAKIVAEQLNNLFEQPQGGVSATTRRYPWESYGGPSGAGPTSGYASLKRNVVVADMRTNSVIVTATEQNMRFYRDMIEKLDAPQVLSEITQSFPLKFAKAADLADTLNRLFRGEYRRTPSFFDFYFGYGRRGDEEGPIAELRNVTVVAEEKTNTILVTGPPNSFKLIKDLIEKLDKRTAQVFIEVAIVDVTLDKDTKFGVEWSWKSAGEASDGTPINENASTDFGLARETLGLKYAVLSDNWKGLLHALETRSNVKVLSTPTITTADNVEARISIGQDVPFVSSEEETESGRFRRTVEFKKVAVALTVTPHVNDVSDVVALDVLQTINEIVGFESELNAPIIADREAQTTITVKDGQTIVIGGIIKENRSRITKLVPLLGHIPLIGELFKSREWKTEQSELMVFLTPHILKDDESAARITGETINKLSVQPKLEDDKTQEPPSSN